MKLSQAALTTCPEPVEDSGTGLSVISDHVTSATQASFPEDICRILDRNNDSRTNYDIMAALTYTGEDEEGHFRVAILAYTRKCVGDFLESLISVSMRTSAHCHVGNRRRPQTLYAITCMARARCSLMQPLNGTKSVVCVMHMNTPA